MGQDERKVSVVKNVAAQMTAAVVQTALGFIVRKIFVMYLTTELLGLNGLMTSIIGMLSIAELGVGEAINYSLYKPLAEGDKGQVNAIMRLYRRLYLAIAGVIVVLGVALLPFLPAFLDADTTQPMSYVYQVYGLFLLDTFLSYCLAYSRNIISADQRDYIVTNADTISQLATTVLQIAVLIFTRSFILYLVIKTVVTLVRNIIIFRLSNKMYPYLKEKETKPLTTEYKKGLMGNIKALFVTRVSYFFVSGTDNMLLSSFVSLGSVAVYTNYVTIITLLNKTFNTIFDKAKAGVGNYIASGAGDKLYGLFKNVFFINFLLTTYTTVGLYVVGNELIHAWLGTEFVWPKLILLILAFNNYSRFILQACECFRGAVGLYSPRPFVKYLALSEGLLNLVASLALIFLLEDRVLGVFLGTSISTVVSTVAVPWIVYKFLFQRPLREFFGIYFKYFAVGGAVLVASSLLCDVLYTANPLVNMVIGVAVCTVVMAGLCLLVFRKTEEFRYSCGLFDRFVGSKLRRK